MSKTLNQLWNSTNAVEYIFQKENGVITPIDRNAFCSIIHLKTLEQFVLSQKEIKEVFFIKFLRTKRILKLLLERCAFSQIL